MVLIASKKTKDRIALVIPVALIVAIGIFVSGIDYFFPVPPASEKLNSISETANASFRKYGTSTDADVTVAVFSDFQCPACAAAAPELRKAMEYYGDDVNFVFVHFPGKSGSEIIAQASECAREQGMFWDYHDLLFEANPVPSEGQLASLASSLGMDIEKFSECLESGEKDAKVSFDFREGIRIGISGTPTYIINKKTVVGAQPFSSLKSEIDAELNK